MVCASAQAPQRWPARPPGHGLRIRPGTPMPRPWFAHPPTAANWNDTEHGIGPRTASHGLQAPKRRPGMVCASARAPRVGLPWFALPRPAKKARPPDCSGMVCASAQAPGMVCVSAAGTGRVCITRKEGGPRSSDLDEREGNRQKQKWSVTAARCPPPQPIRPATHQRTEKQHLRELCNAFLDVHRQQVAAKRNQWCASKCLLSSVGRAPAQ